MWRSMSWVWTNTIEIEEGVSELSEEHKTYRSQFEDLYFQTAVECENIINKSNNITVLNNEYLTENYGKIDTTRSSSSNDSICQSRKL